MQRIAYNIILIAYNIIVRLYEFTMYKDIEDKASVITNEDETNL